MNNPAIFVRKHFRIFLLTLLAVVILFNFSKSIINPQNTSLINPTGTHTNVEEIMQTHIVPRLAIKQNSYQLKRANPFVPQAGASDFSSDVSAHIAVDLDNGDVLYEKNFDKKLPIASLTKIMSSIVALDLATPEELITITDFSARQIPTRIGVIPDEQMSLRELLMAVMLTSANDAASVIQVGMDKKYNAPIFIKAMNEKARLIGLKNTSFANPQGFDDPDNYSTVEDLAILSKYALDNYPLFKEIVKMDYAFLPQNRYHKQFDLYNWNGLIGVYPGAMGVKIGNTGEAGKTTVVIAERQNKKILTVVLGAQDLYERDLTAADLLDVGFEKTLNLPRVEVTKAMLQDKYRSWKY